MSWPIWSIICFSVIGPEFGYHTGFVHLRDLSYLTHRLWLPNYELSGFSLKLLIQRTDIQNLIFDRQTRDFSYDFKLGTNWPGLLNLALVSSRGARQDRSDLETRTTDLKYLGGEVRFSLPYLQLKTQLGRRLSSTDGAILGGYELSQELYTNLKPLNLHWNLFRSSFPGIKDERHYISIEPAQELRLGQAFIGFALNLDEMDQNYPELQRIGRDYGGSFRLRLPIFSWFDFKLEEAFMRFDDADEIEPARNRWGQTSELRGNIGFKFPSLRLDASLKRAGSELRRGDNPDLRYRIGDETGGDKGLNLRLSWEHPWGDLLFERRLGLSSITTPHPLNPEDRDEKLDELRLESHLRLLKDLGFNLKLEHSLRQFIWVERFMSSHTRAQERSLGKLGFESLSYSSLRVLAELAVRQDELRFLFAPEANVCFRQGELMIHIGYEANPMIQPLLELGYGLELSLKQDGIETPLHRGRAGLSLSFMPWPGLSLIPRGEFLLIAGRGWEAPREFFYPEGTLGLVAQGDVSDRIGLKADLKVRRRGDEPLDWLADVGLDYSF